ncbi:hypothetical protein BKA81DRAFT_350243 [Phyllosticta paracitricarpa]
MQARCHIKIAFVSSTDPLVALAALLAPSALASYSTPARGKLWGSFVRRCCIKRHTTTFPRLEAVDSTTCVPFDKSFIANQSRCISGTRKILKTCTF